MWWPFVLEMGVAFFLLVFIVWWTMFHGRKAEPLTQRTTPPEQKRPEAEQ
jgi:hypothetical protein